MAVKDTVGLRIGFREQPHHSTKLQFLQRKVEARACSASGVAVQQLRAMHRHVEFSHLSMLCPLPHCALQAAPRVSDLPTTA
jgi:hypothetical protein